MNRATSARTIHRTKTGELNPKWRQQVKNNVNATTPFTGDYGTVVATRSSISFAAHAASTPLLIWKAHCHGDVAYYRNTEPSWAGGWTSNADAKAASKFLEKVRELQVRFSGPTFLGQIRQTLRQFTHPLNALERGINDYLKAVKRANRGNRDANFTKKPKKYIRNLSSIASGLWLEYSFGWIPFFQDISDAREAYNDLLEKERTVTFSASGSDKHANSAVSAFQDAGPISSGLWCMHTVRLTETDSVRYRGEFLAQAATSALDRFARYGFTPSEFLPTAWELLPWSFLIDYFVNIGDLINAAVVDTSSVKWVNRSQIRQVDKFNVMSPSRDETKRLLKNSGWVLDSYIASTSQCHWRRRLVSRASSGIPCPTLTFNLVSSDTRLLNVAALLQEVGLTTNPQRLSGRNYRL
jgi:hypothetical protein